MALLTLILYICYMRYKMSRVVNASEMKKNAFFVPKSAGFLTSQLRGVSWNCGVRNKPQFCAPLHILNAKCNKK